MLVPPQMDGVSGINGFNGIESGQTGTYWYHAHSNAQEQEGLYGGIIIDQNGFNHKKPKAEKIAKINQTSKSKEIKTKERAKERAKERDYLVLISDFSEESSQQILANLKSDSGYYNYSKPTIGDFFFNIKNLGFKKTWQNLKNWGQMRMSPTDISDVGGYHFLINGKTDQQKWNFLYSLGQKVKLRFINGSAMSIYDLKIEGLKMLVVAADGQQIETVEVDEIRLGNAETYDVLVEPKEDKIYNIIAEPIDRSGFALATLATSDIIKKEKGGNQTPKHQPRPKLTMADMPMGLEKINKSDIKKNNSDMDMEDMDMSEMSNENNHQDIQKQIGHQPSDASYINNQSGWSNFSSTDKNYKILNYSDLRYFGAQTDLRKPEQEITLTLNGNMQRYI